MAAPVSSPPNPSRGPLLRRNARLLPVAPAVILLLVFLLAQIAWSFYASFTNTSLSGRTARSPEWTGLDNYIAMLTDPTFPTSAMLTLLFVATSAVVGQNVLGLVIALLMARARTAVSALVG